MEGGRLVLGNRAFLGVSSEQGIWQTGGRIAFGGAERAEDS